MEELDRAHSQAAENQWRNDIAREANEMTDNEAVQTVFDSLEEYPNVLDIPADELAKLVKAAQVTIESAEIEIDRKVLNRAHEILDIPEAEEILNGMLEEPEEEVLA